MHPHHPSLTELRARARAFGRDLLSEQPDRARIWRSYEMEGFWELHRAVDAQGQPWGVEAWLLVQEELSTFDPWRAWALAGAPPPACSGGRLDPGVLLLWGAPGEGARSARPLLAPPAGWLLATPQGEGWALSALNAEAVQLDLREEGLSTVSLPAGELPQLEQLDSAEAARLALGASLGAAARLCGVAAAALSALRGYAAQHARFGRALLQQQGLAFELAEVDTQLYAARLLLHRVGAQLERGARAPLGALARPLLAAQEVAARATQLDARVQAAAALPPHAPSQLRRAQCCGLVSAGLSPAVVGALSLGELRGLPLGELVV